MSNKLKGILSILRGRPTIYRVHATISMEAEQNRNLYVIESSLSPCGDYVITEGDFGIVSVEKLEE